MADLSLTPIDVTTLTPVAPQLTDLTTVALEGEGAFDVLMRAVRLHLTEEYNANRIVGKEYATVYLGAMSAVMQQAVNYLLNKSQIDQLNAQIGLIRQQIVTELARTDDTIPEGLGFNASTSVLGTLIKEKERITAEIAKLEADTANQNLVTTSQIEVNDQQILKMQADITDQHSKITSDIAVNDKQIDKMTADITDQGRKITSEIAVNDKQIVKMTADITDQSRKIDSDILVNTGQINKMEGEALLLGQKTITELAKTDNVIPTKSTDPGNTNYWLNSSSTVGGTMQKQDALYAAQTDGFARDAEQKLAKIMADTWSVRMSTDTAVANNAGLGDDDIRSVIEKARTSIGATPINPTS